MTFRVKQILLQCEVFVSAIFQSFFTNKSFRNLLIVTYSNFINKMATADDDFCPFQILGLVQGVYTEREIKSAYMKAVKNNKEAILLRVGTSDADNGETVNLGFVE